MAKLFINEDLLTKAYSSSHDPKPLNIHSPQFVGEITSYGITIEPRGTDEKNPEYVITIITGHDGEYIKYGVPSNYIVVYQNDDDADAASLSIIDGESDKGWFGITKCPYTFTGDGGSTYVVLNEDLPPKKISGPDTIPPTAKLRAKPITVGSMFILRETNRFRLFEVTHIMHGCDMLEMKLTTPYHVCPDKRYDCSETLTVISGEFLNLYWTDKISYREFENRYFMPIDDCTCIVVDACSGPHRVWNNVTTDHKETALIFEVCNKIAGDSRYVGRNKPQIVHEAKSVLVNDLPNDIIRRLNKVIFLFPNDVVIVDV